MRLTYFKLKVNYIKQTLSWPPKFMAYRHIPANSNFTVIIAIVGVSTLAFSLMGTNPDFCSSNSCSPAQTPRVVKCPLAFVCARMLYGVSASDMFTSDSGTFSIVKILPERTWRWHVHVSQASFSVPLVQFLEQSKAVIRWNLCLNCKLT